MKKFISILLIVAFCLSISGCQQKTEPIKSPVTFYYSRAEFDHGNQDSVILGETRESAGLKSDLIKLLNEYLAGPLSDQLTSPSPGGTRVKNIWIENDVAILSVTDQMSLARGIQLTLACACLAKTFMEISGIETVKIQAQTVKLSATGYILIDKDNILLLDSTEINP